MVSEIEKRGRKPLANPKSARIAVNVEESIYVAMEALAEKEGMNLSELGRALFINELNRQGLLPDATIRRMAGLKE